MVLGGIDTKTNYSIGSQVAEKDFDFSPLEKRIMTLEERQKYLMIAFVLLALYTIFKK